MRASPTAAGTLTTVLRAAAAAALVFSSLTAVAETAQRESAAAADTVDARALIAAAIDLTRGRTSFVRMTMVVHRPDWERTSTLVAWTRGREDALIRFTEPARDAGNATLKQGDRMWTFTPKLNRTIRLPFSLMSQSWAGSDFSYNDLSRTDKLLHYYDLGLTGTQQRDGHAIYTIDAVPHDDAPVVWGKEQLVLRDDYVLLSETFFDQSLTPLKRMETLEIGELGGRTFGTRMRMLKLDEQDHYTEISYAEAQFDLDLPDQLFTLFALKSGATPETLSGGAR
ncbi:MAG: outer membrane lipoprotein-sorting protein [Pseudomonadales bacterium]